ncbi:MAG: helix-turn-helix domain-containing protein [Christensenellales bacterium]|jgi:AraC-like DNA-binding protein
MNYKLLTFKKDIEVLGLYTMYYSEHDKSFYFGGERHNFWEMVYVDSGEISVVAENTGYMVRQGEVIFHKPMEFHTLASNQKDPNSVVIISFEAAGDGMRFFENRILAVDGRQMKILSQLLEEIRHSFGVSTGISLYPQRLNEKSAEPCAQQMVINYMEQFLVSLLRSNRENEGRSVRKSTGAKKNVEEAVVQAVREYLSQQIYLRLTLCEVARHFHMGKSYLSEMFKAVTGKSVMEYYLNLKMDEAKRLLRGGELNITQIAEKLCYANVHNFSRVFKAKTGRSPSAYRKSVR